MSSQELNILRVQARFNLLQIEEILGYDPNGWVNETEDHTVVSDSESESVRSVYTGFGEDY